MNIDPDLLNTIVREANRQGKVGLEISGVIFIPSLSASGKDTFGFIYVDEKEEEK